MGYKRILAATDFSPLSFVGLAHASVIARRQSASLVILHAIPRSLAQIADYSELKREVEGRLDNLVERMRRLGIETSSCVIEDDPEQAIATGAAETGGDLVVVGTHGRTGVSRLLLGSVAEKLVRTTDKDILIARPGGAGDHGPSRVLVATDFSETAERALASAVDLAAPDAYIELLHASNLAPTTAGFVELAPMTGPGLREQLDEEAMAHATRLRERYRDEVDQIAFNHVFGAPGAAIERRLHDDEFDLVALGSHGRSGWRRLVLGSVAEATVRHAPCSVLVVPAQRASHQK